MNQIKNYTKNNQFEKFLLKTTNNNRLITTSGLKYNTYATIQTDLNFSTTTATR